MANTSTGDFAAGLPDFGDRAVVERLLGIEYEPRHTAPHGSVARGIADITLSDGATLACTAYQIDGGKLAQGFIYDRRTACGSLILAPADRRLTQSELAEAVDYWESGNDCRFFSLYEKSCGAIVFTDDGGERKYLMIRMNLGHCGLPKGHVEKFETEKEAAIREVLEETGVHITLLDGFRETVEYPISAKTRKMSVYFIGRFDGDKVKIQPSEICGYKLSAYDEARSYITHDNDRAIFDNAVKWLEEHRI